ncbi:MAG: serpin family protein [Bacteroidales bacterium]|nr:serpin family protein [Bacteroidales bacterium]
MKRIFIPLIIAFIGCGCDWVTPDDPVFDYNLKSAKVIHANNDFGLELFNKVVSNDPSANMMISPASIGLAMGMTYNGAETSTKAAFDSVFNYEGLTREEVNSISLDLVNTLGTNSRGNLLEIANSIWYRNDLPVYQSFIEMNKTYYNAMVKELDFSDPASLDEINGWVAEKTHDKIKKIINQLSPDDMMVLINALYFNCLWEVEFDPENTTQQMFYNEDSTEFGNVEMMTTESTYNYAATDLYSAVEMPYKNEKFSMHLILPNTGTTVNELVELLDSDTWEEWLTAYEEYYEVNVTMPKFKFDYERSLGSDLISMGLGEAFSPSADFSDISEINLMISRVLHKTYIDLNEEGTEAAAATAVVMELTAMPDYHQITLDRPFLFAITENSSHSIVFIGKLSEPSYE